MKDNIIKLEVKKEKLFTFTKDELIEVIDKIESNNQMELFLTKTFLEYRLAGKI